MSDVDERSDWETLDLVVKEVYESNKHRVNPETERRAIALRRIDKWLGKIIRAHLRPKTYIADIDLDAAVGTARTRRPGR